VKREPEMKAFVEEKMKETRGEFMLWIRDQTGEDLKKILWERMEMNGSKWLGHATPKS